VRIRFRIKKVISFALCCSWCAVSGCSVLPTSNSAQSLLIDSGIHTHLSTVQQTVLDESKSIRSLCGSEGRDDLEMKSQFMRTHDPELLFEKSVELLEKKLTRNDQIQLSAWFDTPIGQQLIAAEKRMADATDAEYAAAVSQYEQSNVLTQERFSKVRRYRTLSGAVRFVANLHT